MTPEQRETWKEHQERLYAMAVDDGDTWDLSENDQAACNAGGDAIMTLLDRAALAPPPTCGTWQPIETAPTDGTEILGFGSEGVEIMCYEDGSGPGIDDPGHDAGWYGNSAWPGNTQVRRDSCYYREAQGQPTHWMPLPAAPTEPTR